VRRFVNGLTGSCHAQAGIERIRPAARQAEGAGWTGDKALARGNAPRLALIADDTLGGASLTGAG